MRCDQFDFTLGQSRLLLGNVPDESLRVKDARIRRLPPENSIPVPGHRHQPMGQFLKINFTNFRFLHRRDDMKIKPLLIFLMLYGLIESNGRLRLGRIVIGERSVGRGV
jgi:hypothetical protein